MNAIENLCTRAMLLNSGKVICDGYDTREIISKYLNIHGQLDKSCTWTNSGKEFPNPWFTPEKIYFTDEFGNIVDDGQFNNKYNYYCNVYGTIKELDPALQVGYALYDEDNNLLFWTNFNDDKEENWPKLSKGKFCFSGLIPKRCLNEGLYRVEPMISMYFSEWISQPSVNAPMLYFEINGGLSDSPYWLTRRPGIMVPLLKWKVKKVD